MNSHIRINKRMVKPSANIITAAEGLNIKDGLIRKISQLDFKKFIERNANTKSRIAVDLTEEEGKIFLEAILAFSKSGNMFDAFMDLTEKLNVGEYPTMKLRTANLRQNPARVELLLQSAPDGTVLGNVNFQESGDGKLTVEITVVPFMHQERAQFAKTVIAQLQAIVLSVE